MKITVVKDSGDGIDYLRKLLYSVVDNKTALFLSGGKTPKDTYSQLALEQKINPGAVAMVDERAGAKNHQNSNERMMKETGLLLYFEKKKIPFYAILRLHPKGVASEGVGLGIARDYNKKVKNLLGNFSKKIAIMGIGEDGHTASLAAGSQISNLKSQKYVEEVNDFPGEFKKRITLTFKALSKMNLLIILAFGSAKRNAIVSMFEKGSIEEIPARFYTREDIAKKTILITDQKI